MNAPYGFSALSRVHRPGAGVVTELRVRLRLVGRAIGQCRSSSLRLFYSSIRYVSTENRQNIREKQFPPLSQGNRPPTRADSNSSPRDQPVGTIFVLPPFLPTINGRNRFHSLTTIRVLTNRGTPESPSCNTRATASALGEDINTIISILQMVSSVEVADLAAKFRKAKHSVDRLRIILENKDLIIPANSDRKELPRDVSELIRAKNAALCQVDKYPTCKNRLHARALQRKVKAHMDIVRNENWSNLMIEISPSHQACRGLATALKTEEAVPTPL
ncbi:hypothetical protein EVAR_7739_1 [Eumeta japonica]|uniref:Uncharacterized protein n=1 Tax=Eumeta variegata TaxID=151549 RepID=A0A4C1TJT6_EUMVA|nr:hypothetical protein EVAR_7739_1 [Eumeta japonica]